MLNNCTLIGRLTKDVKIKVSATMPVAKYTIAVRRKFAKQGQQDTDFIDVTSFGRSAEIVSEFFKKGDVIGVTGEIHIDRVDDKYFTNFVADRQFFVGGKAEHSQEPEHSQIAQKAMTSEDEELPF